MQEPGTYQTRISDYRDVDRLDGDATLAAYGELYGRVQRKLFAAFAAGRSVTSLKGEYLREYGIPARMFNAVRVSLEGKIASVREGMQGQRDELEGRVAQVYQSMDQVEEAPGHRDVGDTGPHLVGPGTPCGRLPGRSGAPVACRGGVIRRTRRGVDWQASGSRLAVLGADGRSGTAVLWV